MPSKTVTDAVASDEFFAVDDLQEQVRDMQQRIAVMDKEIGAARQALKRAIHDHSQTRNVPAIQEALAKQEQERDMLAIESQHVRLRQVESGIPAAEEAYRAASQRKGELDRQMGELRAQWAEANATMTEAHRHKQSLEISAAQLRQQLDRIVHQKGL
jgi:chromosome segregation ATPase